MRFLQDYDRNAAVQYAHKWAFGRNPAFYDFEKLGGDCTNFASQCIYAGCKIMNYTPTHGWYYISGNKKSSSWTGVPYFWNFLTRKNTSAGPVGVPCNLEDLKPGDIVQLGLKDDGFQHSPVVVSVGKPATLNNVLIAAHTFDADYRSLSSYIIRDFRCLHITGTFRP